MAASPIALVRSTVLVPIVRFLDHQGAPYEPLFEAVKLSPRLIERPNELFPLAQGFALAERIACTLRVDDVGLLAANGINIHDFGQLGETLCGASTLLEALNALIGGITAFNTGDRLWLDWRGQRLFFRHRYAIRPMPGQRQADAYAVVVMIKAVRLALGSKWKPDEILLPEKERVRKRQYEAFFETCISFENETWAISIPPARLAEPIHKPDPSGEAAQTAPPSPARDLIGSLRQMVRPSLRLACPDIGHAAALTGVSVSTLQRRLRDAGISYSDLVESERLRLSIELLAQKDIKICDVASELGYTEPANFMRAFRKWTGLTPSKFRGHQGAGGSAAGAPDPIPSLAAPRGHRGQDAIAGAAIAQQLETW